jgi:hypothetical protein
MVAPRLATSLSPFVMLVAAGCYQVRPSPTDQVSAPPGTPTFTFEPPPVEPEIPPPPPPERHERLPPVQCDETPTAGCVSSFPRIMIIMDASSSMLAGRTPGENNWDKARFALAGNPDAPSPGDPGYVVPAFDRDLEVRGNVVTLQDVFYLGMLAFNAADTQQLLLQYAPCAMDNIKWAMDPYTSCDPPGCSDPYVGVPEWTFKSSDVDRKPPFVDTTLSYMPPCHTGSTEACIGTVYNTYTREGVEFDRANIEAYRRDADPASLGPGTRFANILITDGETAPDSPPEEVLTLLADEGVPTYVIGLQGRFFGGAQQTLDVLNGYAEAGGTQDALLIRANDQDIADAFAGMVTRIIDDLGTDPCCQPTTCSENPEPRH